ncbi:hypothetical protein [Amphritea sp.]|uniref:hypothetical protein n=1 Tax=Amphritea sp. TaxID=1872502 RepID=UPI003D09FDD1
MNRNFLFRLQTLLTLLVVVSNSYARDQQPLNCDLDEVPAYVIHKKVITKLMNDDADFKGKQTIIVSKDMKLTEEQGDMLDIPARFRGEKIYIPYQRY